MPFHVNFLWSEIIMVMECGFDHLNFLRGLPNNDRQLKTLSKIVRTQKF